MVVSDYQLAIEKAINEDWDLVKNTAGAVNNAAEIFPLAYRFGWHAARKHAGYSTADERIRQLEKQCAVLAAEVDRMRPVVEAACGLISANFVATRADLTSLSRLVRTVREYQTNKPK